MSLCVIVVGIYAVMQSNLKEVNINGETISVKSEIESIPVYIKQGAIIPCEKDGTNYLFIIPSDSESSFVFVSNSFIAFTNLLF